jgi:hypothetical protein
MPQKNVILEWQEGRSCSPRSGHLSTDGVNLYSYAMRIGARDKDGKTIALREFNVSSQTNADMHYANLVADRIVWGVPHEPHHSPVSGWWDTRRFADNKHVGKQVEFKLTDEFARRSTAEKYLTQLQERQGRMYAEFKNEFYVFEQHSPKGDGSFKVTYSVRYRYTVSESDIGHYYADTVPTGR